MKNYFLKCWPILAIFLLVAIFSFPYWAKGQVPFPSAYLVDFFPPWNAYFGMPVKNNAMPDVISQIYPWRKLTIESFKMGQWPLWNPYNFSGNPHLANFQSAVFHPLNFLFFLLSQIDAWSIIVLLQPFLAGIFTYLFCRELKLSQPAALISAIAFAFCGFLVVWMAYGTLGYALLWLPLILYGIERTAKKSSILSSIIISFTVAFSLFSGHFQTSLYVILASFFYLLFRRAFFSLLPFILGIGVAAPQLLPSIEFYRLAPRSEIFLKGEIIPWRYLITLIAPDFFGNPVTRNDWFGHYAEWAGFIGVIPLLLAFYAIFKKQRREIWFFIGLGILSLSLALPTPLLDLLIKLKIPVLSTSAASRIISLFSFSAAILAGFGFDQLKKDLDGGRLKPIFLFSSVALIFVLGIWEILVFQKPFEPKWLLVAKRNFILPTGMFLAFAGLVIGSSFLRHLYKKKRLIIALAILLLTAFDLLRFAKKWMPFDPREYVYPNSPAIEFLRDKVETDRVFGNFGTETQTYFHLPSVEGYDPLYIKRYGEFITTAGDGKIGKLNRSTVYLNKNGLYTEKILNLLGVKYIFHTISDGHHLWVFPFWQYPDQFELIYQDKKHEVYENKRVLPRAFLVYDFEVEKSSQAIIDQMFSKNFDLSKTVILEENPGIELKGNRGQGKTRIVNYTPTEIEISLASSKDGLLFLSDSYYPGWKALVDGKETPIYRANYAFRAVIVPKGKHRVVLKYQPRSFRYGGIISIFSLGMMVLVNLLNPKGLGGKDESRNF